MEHRENNSNSDYPHSVLNFKMEPIYFTENIPKQQQTSSIFYYSDKLQLPKSVPDYISSKFRYPTQIENIQNNVDDTRPLEPHPNSALITPFLKFFNWTLLVPNCIKYERERNSFSCKEGSYQHKCLNYVWLMLMTLYMSLIFFNDINSPTTIKVVISKVTWASYTIFDGAIIKCLCMKGSMLAKLLTEGSRISHLCDKINIEHVSEIKKPPGYFKYKVWIACITGLVYAVGFVLVVIVEITARTTNLYNLFMDLTDDSKCQSTPSTRNSSCFPSDTLCSLFERASSNVYAAILLIFWFTMAFSVELIWITFLMMAASWGLYFKRLFSNCITIIETFKVDLHEGIQIYARITLLMDNFNTVFGSTLLWIVVASVLYKATTLVEFLAGYTHGILYDTINIIGFLPFIATLYIASEVHNIGGKLPNVIKQIFLNPTAREYNQPLKIIHGTTVVQYDILSNNVGFRGLGFFTISYTFVANLVGITITYSLVTLQFKTREIHWD